MRLVTRGDLDGLTSAVIISAVEKIDALLLVHPQDITDKRIEITGQDILANLPYHPKCGMWFDHHLLTDSNEKAPSGFKGRYAVAPSAARLVYDYYLEKDPSLKRYEKLVAETDRLDSAQLNRDDVTEPADYILLGYTIDNRTGLGGFQDYFRQLMDCFKTMTIDEVLAQPFVQTRVGKMRTEEEAFQTMLGLNSRLEKNVIITDLRKVDLIPAGNRFLIYTMFPEGNVSLRIHWGPQKKYSIAAVGHSIFNRTCKTSVGELMSRYGGGGHRGAGTCILPVDRTEETIAEIIAELKKNG